jgi:hypothetical protein
MKQILLPLLTSALILTMAFKRHHTSVPGTEVDTVIVGKSGCFGGGLPDWYKKLPLDSMIIHVESDKIEKKSLLPQSPTTDTTIKPQYNYFYKVPPAELSNLLYVTDSLVFNGYGLELGGTMIKNSQTFYIQFKERLLKSLRVDSVKIGK